MVRVRFEHETMRRLPVVPVAWVDPHQFTFESLWNGHRNVVHLSGASRRISTILHPSRCATTASNNVTRSRAPTNRAVQPGDEHAKPVIRPCRLTSSTQTCIILACHQSTSTACRCPARSTSAWLLLRTIEALAWPRWSKLRALSWSCRVRV